MPSARHLRLVLALADAGLEIAVQAALEADGHEVARCLAAGELLDRLRAGPVDAALVSNDLYQLTSAHWADLTATSAPVVLYADQGDAARWPRHAAQVGRDAGPEELRQALLAAADGMGSAASRAAAVEATQPFADPAPLPGGAGGRVLAVGGPPGAGRTLVAANLAVALNLVASVALVDADLACSCTGPVLDADVDRNLATLAHADPRDVGAWDRALERDGQPLHARSPGGLLLCGLPKPEQRGALTRAFFDRLLGELRRRYAYVLLDVGAEVLSPDTAIHRAALQAADDVLLVARADPLGLWQARATLGVWERQLRLPTERIALVLNQHDRRRHQTVAQIAWALAVPAAAVLPADQAAAERALLTHEPLLFARQSRLAMALLELADRIHGGHILLPAEQARPRGRLGRLLEHVSGRPVRVREGRERHADGANALA